MDNFALQLLAGYLIAAAVLGMITGDIADKKGYQKRFAIIVTALAAAASFMAFGLLALLIYGLIPERSIRCKNCGHVNHFSRTACYQCNQDLSGV